jgi:hypothetical protein
MTNVLELPALDGTNPLGFFAALGLLRVLDCHAQRSGQASPMLAFGAADSTARIWTSLNFEQAVEAVLEDARDRQADVALSFSYDDEGNRDAAGAVRDLKASPSATRSLLDDASAGPRITADLAAAFASELVQDNNGRTKPTAFHFVAGQQQFLKMVMELGAGLRPADLEEALVGPWTSKSTLPSMSWDATVARLYALRAANPSTEKRGSVAGANWLGVLGLSFFPVLVHRRRLVTTAVVGGWKDSVFTWPLWSPPSSARTVAALTRVDARGLSANERQAVGIALVMSARILRADQGGYGSFSPPAAVAPAAVRP